MREIGRLNGNDEDHIRLTLDKYDPPERPRSGRSLRLPLRQKDVKPILQKRATKKAHAGALEATALSLGLQLLARDRDLHEKRWAVLVDSKALRAAAQKGRSSAGAFTFPLRRCAALSIACGWLLRFAYLPSESNPSDWPSRGLNRRQEQSHRKNVVQKDGKFVKYRPSRWELHVRRMEASLKRFQDCGTLPCMSHNSDRWSNNEYEHELFWTCW